MKIFFRAISKTRVICILLIILIPSARDLNFNPGEEASSVKRLAQTSCAFTLDVIKTINRCIELDLAKKEKKNQQKKFHLEDEPSIIPVKV